MPKQTEAGGIDTRILADVVSHAVNVLDTISRFITLRGIPLAPDAPSAVIVM